MAAVLVSSLRWSFSCREWRMVVTMMTAVMASMAVIDAAVSNH